jgi:prolyl-tRNA editing enzyme YbaK/EbsC (Cys-tRNA(Pro) deacylase)
MLVAYQMSENPSILDPRVAEALADAQMAYEAIACDPALSDTAAFCEHYGFPPEKTCNAIVVVAKTTPKQYFACLVTSDRKLDVNHRVAKLVSIKRLSFASSEETAELTGMRIGGVTVVGLPPGIPILIDTHVLERDYVILGGGNRSSKIRLDPHELTKLAGARVAEIAVER